MSYKVILFKPCHSNMSTLVTQGQKKVVQAVRAAMAEASTDGEIKSLPRTKHGESRLPNIEKFDLGDGFRLVVQLIDGKNKTRVFLFVGTHSETQRWLDAHKDYKWVRGRNDRELSFVMVSPSTHELQVPVDRLNFDVSDEDRLRPILYRLTGADWNKLDLGPDAIKIINGIDAETFELQAETILDHLEVLVGYEKASLVFDLLWHSHMGEQTQLQKRLALLHDDADVVYEEIAVAAMQTPENSEAFITFDDTGLLEEIFKRGTLAEWMLFLHPDQKQVSEREFRGPSRLRGVSGSGKTCVLVHRARCLAKKYNQPVLLVTLTESMRKLLERLVDDLCGVERSQIHIKTMSSLAKEVLSESLPHRYQSSETVEAAIKVAEIVVRQHSDFDRSSNLISIGNGRLTNFLRNEISYVRGRLTTSQLNDYLDSKTFQRVGRGVPLNQLERRIILCAIQAYLESMDKESAYDHEGIVSQAIDVVRRNDDKNGRFRCVLSDEVQDLSELDLLLMSLMKTPDGVRIGEAVDGLFLAGDGAQSIYKRGFALRRIGIDIVGRSFNLKKNYRNTHEILKAAFGLVSQFEFADVDEENITKPSTPDLAERHGTRPLLVRCGEEEIEYVAQQIYSSLAMGQSPGQICAIAPTQQMRTAITEALENKKVRTTELRNDVDYESDKVKISTIESAKGHEFSSVYILGLVEGLLPATNIEADELPREASRLYVAMTRARERLVMTYSPRNGQVASRFLSAIQRDCDEAYLRNGEFRRILA